MGQRHGETRNEKTSVPRYADLTRGAVEAPVSPHKGLLFCLLVILLSGSVLFGFQRKNRRQLGIEPKTGRQADTVVGTFMGDPISDITAEEFELFRLGLEDFLEVEDAAEGLGPVFNGRSCALCHSIPAIGGSGTVMETRAGILHEDGRFEELPGGSNFQMFSIPIHSIQAGIPPEANSVAHRKSLPLFGNGLVEAVPDETLIALEDPDDSDGDGISGRATRILDRDSGDIRVGRFGWKAQQSSLFTFGAEAYRDEMGITNVLFPREACPYGVDCELLELIDPAPDPEDAPDVTTGLRGVDNFANFMRLLGPPTRGEISQEVLLGEQIFRSLRCSSCHVESLETGPASSPALAFKRFHPYADFLLHEVGTGDGIGQEDSQPNEVRTVPLWGVRFRGPFLHDGRASNLKEAILMHGAEAAGSRTAFEALSEQQTRVLLAFLKSL